MSRKDQIERLAKDEGPIRRQDVAEALDLSEAYVGTILADLAKETPPRLVRIEQGVYQHPENVEGEDVTDLRENGQNVDNVRSDEDYKGRQFQKVPIIQVGAGQEMLVVSDDLALPEKWIRQTYCVPPEQVCLMKVRGDSMLDTLHPGQRLIAARHDGEALQDGLIYGLRSPLGFQVKRLRFDRIDGERVVWIWSDNDEYADQRRYLPAPAFEEEYDVIAKALEVSQAL
jgi:phage repressor protein C with HTH and peptisase S24 domain